MKTWLKILIPLLVFGGSVFAARQIIANKPEPRTRPSFNTAQSVDATRLSRSDYQVVIKSQGAVRPSRESSLVPEVTGIIRRVSENFVVGGYFKSGEVMLEIDRRDYEIALAQMQASQAQASAQLQEELARAGQAIKDWKSLGRKGRPSELTARVPQLAAARANLAAAEAKIDQAQLDLERTRIIAPYDGRVLEKNIDEGEFVSRGATLGRIYSLASADIRLPLSNRQRVHVPIPAAGSSGVGAKVELSANVAGQDARWQGALVRSEGVDSTTQQLAVIAKVASPFVAGNSQPALQIGQFVTAEIAGSVLQDVFVIPRLALRENGEVLIVDGENRLRKRRVTVLWTDEEAAAISDGLNEGDVLTLTVLGAVTDGTQVVATIDGEAPPAGQRGDGSLKQGGGEGDKEGKQGKQGEKGKKGKKGKPGTGDQAGKAGG